MRKGCARGPELGWPPAAVASPPGGTAAGLVVVAGPRPTLMTRPGPPGPVDVAVALVVVGVAVVQLREAGALG